MKAQHFIIPVIFLILITGKEIYSQEESSPEIKIEVHGDVQFDGRFFTEETKTSINNFYIRRSRLKLHGSLLKDFAFRIMPNFSGSRLDLQDAYIEFRSYSYVRIRGGKFKSPVGLERLQTPTNSMLIESGLPSNLVPNRDIGFMFSGSISDGIINYSAGVFNGVIDGENSEGDNTSDKDFVGRIFIHPFKSSDIEALQGLGIGIAASYEKQNGTITAPMLPSYRTSARRIFFKYNNKGIDGTTSAIGTHTRLSPQAYFYSSRFGLLTEYVMTYQEVSYLSNREIIPPEAGLNNYAWQIAVTVLLTDDKASYNGIKPKNNFNAAQGKWGAFELALRYNELSIDKNTFPIFANSLESASGAKAFAVGLNWYFNQYFRFSINYESTKFEGISSEFSMPDENIILSRLQVAF